MYNSLKDFYKALNSSDAEYVILRNYEELMDEGFLADHPDIDILAKDRNKLRDTLGLRPRLKKDDSIHYYLSVDGKEVEVDLRETGDGYYDSLWEKAIIENRILYRGSFFVPSDKDYYYSLLYHALVHKHAVSDDYRTRLLKMRSETGTKETADLLSELEQYMKEHNYRYTYPEFTYGIFNTEGKDQGLIEKNTLKALKRYITGIISEVKQWARK